MMNNHHAMQYLIRYSVPGTPDALDWVSAKHSVPATVRLYDRLFNVSNPSDEEGVESFADNLNPESLTTLTGCALEANMREAKVGDRFQFMRQGYFCIDKDSTPDNIIINRTVALKDSFKAR
jgi:glutaminyl-tRNA synthetase